jgi:hypothetical protein
MEAAIPAFILFLIVLLRVCMVARRRPEPQPQAPLLPRCRLHRWVRTEDSLVCTECGMEPSLD